MVNVDTWGYWLYNTDILLIKGRLMSDGKLNEDWVHVGVGLYGRKKDSRLIHAPCDGEGMLLMTGRKRPYIGFLRFFSKYKKV